MRAQSLTWAGQKRPWHKGLKGFVLFLGILAALYIDVEPLDAQARLNGIGEEWGTPVNSDAGKSYSVDLVCTYRGVTRYPGKLEYRTWIYKLDECDKRYYMQIIRVMITPNTEGKWETKLFHVFHIWDPKCQLVEWYPKTFQGETEIAVGWNAALEARVGGRSPECKVKFGISEEKRRVLKDVQISYKTHQKWEGRDAGYWIVEVNRGPAATSTLDLWFSALYECEQSDDISVCYPPCICVPYFRGIRRFLFFGDVYLEEIGRQYFPTRENLLNQNIEWKGDSLFESGRSEFDRGNFKNALDLFQQAKSEYEKTKSKKAAGCDPWIEKSQTGIDADDLMESGGKQFKNETYEEALISFQQAKEKYDDIGSAKATECGPWIKKAQTGVDADALAEIAEGEYEAGHYGSALDFFKTAKEKYGSIESTRESECDYWIERAQKGADADASVESGIAQFQNEAYEEALISFQQAKDKYDDIESAKTTECDPWIGKTQTGVDADNLMKSGIEQFQNEAYEEALTSFQQARDKYESIGSSKVSECDLWIKKTQDEMEGTCLGTTFLLALIAGLFLSKRKLF